MGLITINRLRLFPKAHYFLYFGGMASFWPFITVFAKQLGVTEVPVGLLFTIAPIFGLISMPLFGAIADRFKMKKTLFLIFNLINFIAIMLFAFLPNTTPIKSVSLECGEGTSYITQSGIVTGSQTSVRNKCNASDLLLYKSSDVDLCRLTCHLTIDEGNELCKEFLGSRRPTFCGDISQSGLKSQTPFQLEMDVVLKTSEALIVNKVLHLPLVTLAEIGQTSFGYSCDNKSVINDCEINCATNQALDRRLEKINENPFVYTSGTFWSYVCLVLIAWIAFSVVTSVGDALCFQTLGDQPHLYGIQRQWGSMGWGLFSLISGALIDFISQGSLVKNYSPSFYLVFTLLLLNFIVCYKWDVVEEERPKALGRSILELILNPTIAIFIMACVVVGICTGLLWQFLFWYAEDIASCEDMEHIKLLQGLISIVQCFGGELPFFYISSWFIKKLGHVNCMTIVLGGFGLRFLIYSFLTNPWTILPVELLQGVTYGIFYSNMASYAYVISPPGSAATVQGLVASAFEGIGVGAGSLMGGLLYKNISGRLAFRTFGFCTLAFCAIHFISMKFINRRFAPVSQIDKPDEFRSGHSKLEEMKDMRGINRDSQNDYT